MPEWSHRKRREGHERQEDLLPESQEDTGVDVGLNHFAVLANGDFIDNPHWFRKVEEKVAQLSQVFLLVNKRPFPKTVSQKSDLLTNIGLLCGLSWQKSEPACL